MFLSFAFKEQISGTNRAAFTCHSMWPSQARAPTVSPWGRWDSPKMWLSVPFAGLPNGRPPPPSAPPPLYLCSDQAWVQALGDSFLCSLRGGRGSSVLQVLIDRYLYPPHTTTTPVCIRLGPSPSAKPMFLKPNLLCREAKQTQAREGLGQGHTPRH